MMYSFQYRPTTICFEFIYWPFCIVISDFSHFALFDPYWGIDPFDHLNIKNLKKYFLLDRPDKCTFRIRKK